ncbi:MAG: hypothetical protein KGI66_01355 [Patescibacteria group bacterium]|nr:hypothetical protein [Patescibacteria group bacterium]
MKMKKEAEKMSDTESVDWWDKEVNHWKERLEWWHTTAFYDALILLGVSTGLFLLIWVMF